MKGKVSGHNFAFSAADTKSTAISRLVGREKVVRTQEISPFGDSAKSKQGSSSAMMRPNAPDATNPAFFAGYFAPGDTNVWTRPGCD